MFNNYCSLSYLLRHMAAVILRPVFLSGRVYIKLTVLLKNWCETIFIILVLNGLRLHYLAFHCTVFWWIVTGFIWKLVRFGPTHPRCIISTESLLRLVRVCRTRPRRPDQTVSGGRRQSHRNERVPSAATPPLGIDVLWIFMTKTFDPFGPYLRPERTWPILTIANDRWRDIILEWFKWMGDSTDGEFNKCDPVSV